MFRSMGFVCLWVAAVAAQAVEVPEMPAAPRPALVIPVNCNQGESIQAAVDAAVPPMEVLITGICVENVLIRDKDVSLRGAQSPSLDGIRSAIPVPALAVRGSVIAQINDLSFSNSPGQGVAIRGGANMTINNCLFENNATGLRVDTGAFVIGNGLTFNANFNSNTNTAAAQFFCIGCDFSGGGPAAVSTRSAVASLLDSVVTGNIGIVADQNGAHVDFDCTINTPHPCSLTTTGPAAIATFGGTAILALAGDFIGHVVADDRGTVRLNGSVQRVTGQPNIVDSLGQIIVSANVDVTPPAQSAIRDITASRFARVLLTDRSVLQGSIQCTGAADAFLDRFVTRSQGSTVTNCPNGVVR